MNHGHALFDEEVTYRVARERERQHHVLQNDDAAAGLGSMGTYNELVQEVEKISEDLVKAQTRLSESEEEVQYLRHENMELRRQDCRLHDEIERLQNEILDRDEGFARPVLEQRLRRAVEFLRKDLNHANEKYEKACQEIETQKDMIATMKAEREKEAAKHNSCEAKASSTEKELVKCRQQLREATDGNATLLEEVGSLREEVNRLKLQAEKKDELIREEVSFSVKEKLKHEIRESVTKQVTEKVTREVDAKLKSKHEKELSALRDQIKKVIKENTELKSKLEAAEKLSAESEALQQDLETMTHELIRYESMIKDIRHERDSYLSKVETDYRMKLQIFKEEAAKEKWAHASEIRNQMIAEREREVESFTQRVETLSKQTDKLLEKAEAEKHAYAASVKRRVEEALQKQICELSDEHEARSRDYEQMIDKLQEEKETFEELVRMKMEEEANREINKYVNRIETLVAENNTLKKRIETLAGDLSLATRENEDNREKLTRLRSDAQNLEDENFSMKRKLQNVSTLANRYKQDAEEATKALEDSKIAFREKMLKLEDERNKLSEQKLSKPLSISNSKASEIIRTLEDTKRSLLLRVKLYEEENDRLKSQNQQLRYSMQEKTKMGTVPNTPNEISGTLASRTSSLEESLRVLGVKLKDLSVTDVDAKDEVLLGMEMEGVRLKACFAEAQGVLNQLSGFTREMSGNQSTPEFKCIQDELGRISSIVEKYQGFITGADKSLSETKKMMEEARSEGSDDDTMRLVLELRTIARINSQQKEVKLEAAALKDLARNVMQSLRKQSDSTICNSGANSAKKNADKTPKGKDIGRLKKDLFETEHEIHQLEKKLDHNGKAISGPNQQQSSSPKSGNKSSMQTNGVSKKACESDDKGSSATNDFDEIKCRIRDLTQANRTYTEQIRSLKKEKDAMEKALRLANMEKGIAEKKAEEAIVRAKVEHLAALRQLEETEAWYKRALRESDDERKKLQDSLNDVKEMIFGHSATTSSHDGSFRSQDCSGRSVSSQKSTEETAADESTTIDTSPPILDFTIYNRKEKKQVSWSQAITEERSEDNETPRTRFCFYPGPELLAESQQHDDSANANRTQGVVESDRCSDKEDPATNHIDEVNDDTLEESRDPAPFCTNNVPELTSDGNRDDFCDDESSQKSFQEDQDNGLEIADRWKTERGEDYRSSPTIKWDFRQPDEFSGSGTGDHDSMTNMSNACLPGDEKLPNIPEETDLSTSIPETHEISSRDLIGKSSGIEVNGSFSFSSSSNETESQTVDNERAVRDADSEADNASTLSKATTSSAAIPARRRKISNFPRLMKACHRNRWDRSRLSSSSHSRDCQSVNTIETTDVERVVAQSSDLKDSLQTNE